MKNLLFAPLMNARQLRAKRRRHRQKQKKLSTRQDICTAAAAVAATVAATTQTQLSPPPPQSLLNKRVTFDYFTFDSTGVILITLTGTIIKIDTSSSEELLTILLDHNEQQTSNKRTLSLFGAESNLIEATASSLLNFKLKYRIIFLFLVKH